MPRRTNTSAKQGPPDSRGRLAALAGVAPPLRQTFAYITRQQLPLAMRDLLRRIDRRAGKATTLRRNPEPPRTAVETLVFYASIAAVAFIVAAFARQWSRR